MQVWSRLGMAVHPPAGGRGGSSDSGLGRPQNWLRRRAPAVLLGLGALLAGLLVPVHAATAGLAASTQVTAGYRDFSYGTSVSAPTGQKPQSKLWYTAGGQWWGVLYNSAAGRWEIYKFTKSTQSWSTTGISVDTRKPIQVDTLYNSSTSKLYVITHVKDTSSTTDVRLALKRFSFSGTSYTADTGYPVTIVNKKVEAAVFDQDSSGKLWLTYTDANSSGGRNVYVTHSSSEAGTSWVTPYVLPATGSGVAAGAASNLNADDISTLVTTGGKVGVLWSNQNVPALYFATHPDGSTDENEWTTVALCATYKCPDDHLNIKSVDASGGQAVAAVKTSLNDGTNPDPYAPLIVVYRINLNDLADRASATAWQVRDNVTRAIVVLDTPNSTAYAYAAGPCCSGGTVYEKSGSFIFPSGSSFGGTGLGTPFIKSSTDTKINNPTSTKQSVNSTSGLVVLAGDDGTRYYLHGYRSLGATTPPPDTTAPTVTGTSPANGATGVAVSSNVSATFSEAMDPATLSGTTFTLESAGGAVSGTVTYDSASNTATLNPASDLAAGITYTATVTTGAKDLAGNALASAKTWTFTTASAGTTTQTVTLKATEDAYIQSDAATTPHNGTSLVVDAVPVMKTYLKFDLSNVTGTITAAKLQLRTGTNSSGSKQSVKLVADNGWSEGALIYNGAPPLGSTVLGTLGPTSTGTTYNVTLTAASLQGNVGGPLSLGLEQASTTDDAVFLESKEAGTATPPTLVLTISTP